MKLKKMLSLILIGILLILIAISVYQILSKNKEIDILKNKIETTYPEIYDTIGSMTVEQFKDKIDKKETFLVYVGRPTCGDCNLFEPNFIRMINNNNWNNDIEYLNVAQIKKYNKQWVAFKKNYNIDYTPTIAFYREGTMLDKIEWLPEKNISMHDLQTFINKYKNDIQ